MAKKSFESIMEELEDIVSRLQKGDLALEESIKLYSKGMELAAKCRGRLEAAEKLLEEHNSEEE